jgi:hypothetical protein
LETLFQEKMLQVGGRSCSWTLSLKHKWGFFGLILNVQPRIELELLERNGKGDAWVMLQIVIVMQ